MTAKKHSTLTQERLKELLHYDPEAGVFTWLVRSAQRIKVGDETGYQHPSSGYIYIRVCGKLYRAHRLAFLYMLGEFPPNDVDHRDGCPSNNKWKNLRHSTDSENQQNRKLSSSNKTGFTGVSYNNRRRKFVSTIRISKKNRCLGYFNTAEEANIAYCKAKAKHHAFQPVPRT